MSESFQNEISDAIESANDADVMTWGMPEFCSYRSGDPAYDYDLSGAAIAALKDVCRMNGEGVAWDEAIQIIGSRLEDFHAACEESTG